MRHEAERERKKGKLNKMIRSERVIVAIANQQTKSIYTDVRYTSPLSFDYFIFGAVN